MHLMKNFIKSSNISLSSSSIDEILKDFSQKSMQFSLSFIKELSKETLLELYPYFYKYKDVFNINDTIIDEMRNILKNKIYKLYFMMFKQIIPNAYLFLAERKYLKYQSHNYL